MTLEAGQQKILNRANRILAAAMSRVEDEADWRVKSPIEEVRIVVGYSEPGYGCTDSIIAFGNWNTVTAWKDGKSEELSTLPEKLGELLEKAGVECEWSDEWTECGSCCKAVRTQADSYSWTPSFVYDEGEITCADCVLEDPENYLSGLEGEDGRAETGAYKAVTLNVDPEQHGYSKLPESYANGLHPGQNDNPGEIADSLAEHGIRRFLFKIEAQGQFDTHFGCYVANEELADFAQGLQQEHYESCDDPDFCAHDEAPAWDDVFLVDGPDATDEQEQAHAAKAGLKILAARLGLVVA